MKRLAFLASLFGIGAFAQAPAKKKFYITGLYHTDKLNDCTLPPIECYGKDRLEALAYCGLTVWTEEEWKSVVAGDFQKNCDTARKLRQPK